MTEVLTLSQEEMKNPQEMLWVDLVRTNSVTFRGIEPTPESQRRAADNVQRALLRVELCGGFERYWEQFCTTDWMAYSYHTHDTEEAYAKALEQFTLQTKI